MQFSWAEKIGLGVLVAAWLVFGANMLGNSLVHVDELEQSAYQVISSDGAENETAKEDAAPEDNALALLATADVARGAKVFKKCASCHASEEGGKNKVGPNLWDVVGRAKGGADGFAYSGAMTEAGGDWNYADLDAFLAKPKDFISGTKMSFNGLSKASDRAAVIVYLRSLSGAPKPLP